MFSAILNIASSYTRDDAKKILYDRDSFCAFSLKNVIYSISTTNRLYYCAILCGTKIRVFPVTKNNEPTFRLQLTIDSKDIWKKRKETIDLHLDADEFDRYFYLCGKMISGAVYPPWLYERYPEKFLLL